MIREDFLHQNAFHEVDTYTSISKQCKMLNLIKTYDQLARESLQKGVGIKEILELDTKEKISRAKYIEEESVSELDNIEKELKKKFKELVKQGEE